MIISSNKDTQSKRFLVFTSFKVNIFSGSSLNITLFFYQFLIFSIMTNNIIPFAEIQVDKIYGPKLLWTEIAMGRN